MYLRKWPVPGGLRHARFLCYTDNKYYRKGEIPMTKLLAVQTEAANYAPYFQVSCARSFEEAKEMILRAEQEGCPFDTLDLPARDEESLWRFLDWMAQRGKRYSFSIHGQLHVFQFIRIRDRARARGFYFND